MDDRDGLRPIASVLERLSWAQIFLSMLTQLSATVAFPAYSIVLGFWGVYSAYTMHPHALFGFITFAAFSLVLDIVFCASMEQKGDGVVQMALVVFIFMMFVKLPLLFYSSRLFSATGGATSLDRTREEYSSATPAKGNYAFE